MYTSVIKKSWLPHTLKLIASALVASQAEAIGLGMPPRPTAAELLAEMDAHIELSVIACRNAVVLEIKSRFESLGRTFGEWHDERPHNVADYAAFTSMVSTELQRLHHELVNGTGSQGQVSVDLINVAWESVLASARAAPMKSGRFPAFIAASQRALLRDWSATLRGEDEQYPAALTEFHDHTVCPVRSGYIDFKPLTATVSVSRIKEKLTVIALMHLPISSERLRAACRVAYEANLALGLSQHDEDCAEERAAIDRRIQNLQKAREMLSTAEFSAAEPLSAPHEGKARRKREEKALK
mmetsp:Transcript_43294/g.106925  ORF Transcript_43294/g.106925 Transcript_43294/m.106925 type:complete len:298 (-) Transcript_43294:434-1327(-)